MDTTSTDLFNPANADDLYKEVANKGLVVDILVNAAGQGLHGEFAETDSNREIEFIQLNIVSLVVLTRHF